MVPPPDRAAEDRVAEEDRAPSRRRFDPDRLAHLEEERDFLLRSLDDLDAEFEAGDVTTSDYEELRDGYTVRAAAAIRGIDAMTAGRDDASVGEGAGRRSGRWGVMAAVVVFAALAGVLLARNVGLRTGDDTLTGTVADGAGRVQSCIDESFADPARGIACFDEVLEDSPDDLEARTYRAWARIRSDDPDTGRDELDAVISDDPRYPDAYVFLAVVARDEGDPVAAQTYLDQLFALDPSPALRNTLTQLGLEREIAEALLSEGAAECWTAQDAALTDLNAALTAEATADDEVGNALDRVLDADRCWVGVLEATPDDVDALTLRAYGLLNLDLTLRAQDGAVGDPSGGAAVGPEIAALDANIGALLDRALAVRSDDPDALVLRAALRYVTGDRDGAVADLDALGTRRVSPLLSGVDAETVRSLVEGDDGTGGE